MDPPSVTDEVPEPKIKLDPEEETEIPAPDPVPSMEEMPTTPPPVPPKPEPEEETTTTATTSTSTSTSTSTTKEEAPPLQDEKKDEPTPSSTPAPQTNDTSTTTPTPTPIDTSTPSNTDTTSPLSNSINLLPLSPKQRTISFDELRSYETKRRTIYLKKLKNSSLYWRAFRETLCNSYEETERAEILMQGSVVANEAYAEYLKCAAEDRLDYNGKALDEKKARRLNGEKMKKYSLGAGGTLWNTAAMNEKQNSSSSIGGMNGGAAAGNAGGQQEGETLQEATPFQGLADDSMLKGLIECHEKMAEKFHENFTFIKEVTLAKTTALRKELEAEVNIMSMLGDVTIYELEKAEDDVQKAWAAYYALASLYAGEAAHTKNMQKGKTTQTQITDVWLVEMHYRMSVAYLTTIWEKCAAELSDLFASMKELECNRRFRLHELLVLYTQRAERLWLSVPSMITSVTKDLVSMPTDTAEIEKEVQTSIRTKAQIYQKKDQGGTAIDPLKAPGLAGSAELKPGYELQSPLMSDLLGKTQVIWRKNEKIMSVWKSTLAIATSDCYLHLFDIPHYSNVTTGSAPDAAFQALVPPVRIPTEEDLRTGNYPYGSNWFDNLVPTQSIDLRCSKITFNETKGNSTFELTEILPPNKLSTVSNFVRKKKLALRMHSSQQMVEWLLAFKNYGAE